MRTRIVGLVVWISVLTVALFGVPLAVGVWRYAFAQERTDLERHADAVAIAVAADVLRKEPIDDGGWNGDTRIAVYDDDLDRIAGDGPTGAGRAVTDALNGKHGVAEEGTTWSWSSRSPTMPTSSAPFVPRLRRAPWSRESRSSGRRWRRSRCW